MALLEKDLAEYLEDEGIGTVGTDIFIGQQNTTTPKTCVIINKVGGDGDNRDMAFINAEVSIIARSDDYASAHNLIEDVRTAITRTINQSLGSGRKYVMFIHSTNDRTDLGRDVNGLVESFQNYAVRYRDPV